MNKIIGLVMLSGILAVLGGICELTYFGTTETSRLTALMTSPHFGQSTTWIAQGAEIASYTWDWIVNLFGILFFNYAFFKEPNSQWLIVRYILCLPVSIGIVWMVVSMLRGVNS